MHINGCSSVGPGLAHHPGDCALGITWADCLPGTRGYNNGGVQQTRAEDAKKHNDAVAIDTKLAADQCRKDFEASELDPIRNKVELYRDQWDAAPPFAIVANDNFPTDDERPAIFKWATLRDACINRSEALTDQQSTVNAAQVEFLAQERSFRHEAMARVTDLILALYQQKLTYGEFAHKRYEIGHESAAAEISFRQATLEKDQQRQLQAQALAQQQFANNLAVWRNYMQAVNARQPQTVHVDGTIWIR